MHKTFGKVMILITIILMDILSGSELDLFVPSFLEIKDHFKVSIVLLEALLSVNFAGYCLSLFFVGGLADRYGRKLIILLGLAIFIIGSAICTFISNYNLLLAGRFLQGVGVAAPAILCFLIIADTYPLKKQQYFMGVLNGIMNVAVAGAPVIGSYITMYFHWRANFMVLLILGCIIAIMTILYIPKYKLPKIKESISITGYTAILKSRTMTLLIINDIFMCIPYWIFLGMSSILYMEDLNVSLSVYGYYQGAWTLVFALGSIFFGLIIEKFSAKRMLYISLFTCLIGLFLIILVVLLDIKDPLIITLSFMPFTLGSIIPDIILYPIALEIMPKAKGRISALMKSMLLILTAFSLEITGYFHNGSFKSIGIVISILIIIGTYTLFSVIRNPKVNKFF